MSLVKSIHKVWIVFAATLLLGLIGAGYHYINNTFAKSDLTESQNDDLDAKFVSIYYDSRKLTIKTSAKTVGEAITKAEIPFGEFDRSEPSPDTIINADNFFINIYRAHPVVLIDGIKRIYLMTTSYDPGIIMKEAGILVYDNDEIIVNHDDIFLETGVASVYRLKRNGGSMVTVESEIPFDEQTIKDYNIPVGTTEVRQLGEIGRKETIYEVRYLDGQESERKLVSEKITAYPVDRIVAIGASPIEKNPLTAARGRNRYTVVKDGSVIERQETFYDLPMSKVMSRAASQDGCSKTGHYSIREDGVKIDDDGYVIVAANLNLYPRCSVVETSLGAGKVYDTGSFAETNPEQFDIATDWSNHNGN